MEFSIRSRIAVVAVLGLALAGCRAPRAEIAKGTYYTQYTLQYEKNATRSTNYRRGAVLPINSEVTLLDTGGRRAVVRIEPDGPKLTLEHMSRHTHDTLEVAFAKVFAEEPVDISAFSEEEQAAIREGRALIGMGREAVLAAMGPPPASGTASLESNAWRYWETRFNTFYVRFDKDGRVIDARGR